jgi:hypothetical protein
VGGGRRLVAGGLYGVSGRVGAIMTRLFKEVHMSWRWLLLVAVMPLLAGCESPFHPLRGGVGYTDMPVGADSIQVSFSGSEDMSMATARRFAYLRAAELAALRGKPYFQVLAENIYITWGMHYWPGTDYSYVEGFGPRHEVFIHHMWEPGYVEPYTRPDVVLQIQLFAAPGPQTIPAGYLLRQAEADKIKLSPGVAERIPALPQDTGPVTLPPAPAPTTNPALPATNPVPATLPAPPH